MVSIWTHRDPLKVIPSVASLVTSLHSAHTRSPDPLAIGSEWNDKMHLAVSRGLEFDTRQNGAPWCHHLQYADLVSDPVEAVRQIYASFGEAVHPLHEERMRVWMRDRPQETFGRHGYDMADFGLQPDPLRERYADYCRRFDIPPET